MSNLKLRFIKPCRTTDSSPVLTPDRVIENKKRSTETTLILDLNILIRMEEVFLENGNPDELGLMGLVNLVNQCPKESLCITPGFALNEVHPKFKKRCFELFEVFLSTFCPQMKDHFTAIRHSEEELGRTRALQFDELDISEQYLHSWSYYSLILIHIIDSKCESLSPSEKFRKYLNTVCTDINLLTAVEAEIAKYCFCEKQDSYSQDFKDRIQAIKDNFLERNTNPKQRLKNIFNGVRDLTYGKAALKFSEEFFFGRNQETWIATLDSKFFWLSESIYHYPVDGEPHGKHYTIVRSNEQLSCPYWQEVDIVLNQLSEERQLNGKAHALLNEDGIISLHSKLINKGFNDFMSTFSSYK